MSGSRWSRLAVLLSLLGCSADAEQATSTLHVEEGDDDDDAPVDAGKADAGKGSKPPPASTPGTKKDAGTPTAELEKEPENCGESGFTTRAVMPDMMIVLDRSGSMMPDIDPALRCDNLTFLDFDKVLTCGLNGIDCTRPADQMLIYCGGTQTRGAVDRWTPSVAAVKTLTSSFDNDVRFGLMTFPAASNKCGPGDLQVPVAAGSAQKIADVLGKTKPGGGTPTGESLRAVLTNFEAAARGPDLVKAPQYVLLVTDGQPTCPNTDGRFNDANRLALDKQHTIDAIDALRNAGIKTFVVGYDAAIDPALVTALSEFAQHGDTDHYYPVQNEASLVAAFTEISKTLISCDFQFDERVEDASYLHVRLDDKDVRPDPAEGWTITGSTVTINGGACATLQAGRGHSVKIVKDCKPVIYY